MEKLADLISMNGMELLLEHVRAMIAIVEQDGTLVSWNTAFDSCKKLFPDANKLNEFFPFEEKERISLRLNSTGQEHWLVSMPFPDGEEDFFIHCDCRLIPMPEGRRLFIAEEVNSNSAFQEVIERLNRKVKLFQIESEVTKKIARNKQIEMEAVMTQAQEVAEIDPLTFLPNRRTIVKHLQLEVERSARYNTPLSISVIDLDHFKKVNDTYGHLVGDEVLRQVAYKLRDQTRVPDMAGRYAGEEFLIVLPNSDVTAASEQAMRLCKEISGYTVRTQEHSINVTVSVGIAQFRHGVDTWDTLLNRADNAMYEAKNTGRNRWIVDA